MKLLRIGGLATALVVVAGLGAALAPVAHGQGSAPRARTYQVLGGGSEIGVSIRDVDEADSKAAKGTAGVLVVDVSTDSPAATAGIKKGDIVVEFDGERVRSVRQFTRLVSETPAGRKVSVSVSRDGQHVTLSVEPRANDAFGRFDSLRVLGDFGRDFEYAIPPAPPAPPASPAPPTPPAPPAFPDLDTFIWRTGTALGVSVQELPSQLAQYFGAKDGVLVTSVAEETAGAKAGLKAGDVITAINGSSIESASELRRSVQRMNSGDAFTIEVLREKKSLTLKGTMEERNRRATFRSIV